MKNSATWKNERLDSLKDSVSSAYDKAGEAFDQLPDGEDRDTLQKFAFICNLSFDVYLKNDDDRTDY